MCKNHECVEKLRRLHLSLSDEARTALETEIENIIKDKEPLIVIDRPDEAGKYVVVCVDKDRTV